MKIRLIVKHTFKPKNPKRRIVKNVTYHANADGTVTTTTSKKIIDLQTTDTLRAKTGD